MCKHSFMRTYVHHILSDISLKQFLVHGHIYTHAFPKTLQERDAVWGNTFCPFISFFFTFPKNFIYVDYLQT